ALVQRSRVRRAILVHVVPDHQIARSRRDRHPGGRIVRPPAGVAITPRAGNLVIWNNMDEYGAPNPGSLHQGMPVEQGVKYVLTKWYRERLWCQ
ncbi:MAG: hypothetical protein EOO66_11995, partial [Methylobacterium sp.]